MSGLGDYLDINGPESEETLGWLYRRVSQTSDPLLLLECSPRVAALVSTAARNGAHGDLIFVDRRIRALTDLRRLLQSHQPDASPLFYHGAVGDFLRDIPVRVGIVVLGGAGSQIGAADLSRVGRLTGPDGFTILLPTVPEPDRQRLATTGSSEEFAGIATILRPADSESEVLPHLPPDRFRRLKTGLDRRYLLLDPDSGASATPVAVETEAAREPLLRRYRGRKVGWPYSAPPHSLPDTLPDGQPWPRISVVTASFNQGKYLDATILSVLNQGYPNVEHIVVDGGSTDETGAVLERYRSRLAHVVSEKDRGQSHAINKGMAVATGEILTWLNSDDMLAPGALPAIALAFFTSGADMVAGICTLIKNDSPVGHHLTSCEEGPLRVEELLDQEGAWNAGQFFYQPEVMFTRALWNRAGGRVREDLFYSMDYDLWVRFAEAGAKLHVIGRPVAWFRMHGEQKTSDTQAFKNELRDYRKAYVESKRIELPAGRPVHPERAGLRVVMLNDLGFRYGAGIAHRRLARTLQLAGHDVSAMALHDRSSGLSGITFDLNRLLEQVAAQKPEAIIVGNLHWTQTDPLLVSKLAELAPTFCVLHDFWLLTGRCAYTADCSLYLTGCDETCPTPNEYPSLEPDRIADAWNRKRTALSAQSGPVLLAASDWASCVARDALESIGPELSATRLARIRLGVPTHDFSPLDKSTARKLLGLPANRFLILISGNPSDARKGIGDVFEALRKLDLPDLSVVLSGNEKMDDSYPVENVIELGYIGDPCKQVLAYSAVDLFIGASRAETFGQVFVEAAACGTPSIGYGGSGVAEAILPGLTGSLVEHRPAALAAAILEYYRDSARTRRIGEWARWHVENEWSQERAYLSLFRAFRKLGLLEKWKLPNKIGFLHEPPSLPDMEYPFRGSELHASAHTLSAVEKPIPDLGLDEYRWSFGPASHVEYQSPSEAGYTLFLKYRNPFRHQRLKVFCNAQQCFEKPLPYTGYNTSRLLLIDMEMSKGKNVIRFEFSQWNQDGADTRPLALLIEQLELARVS